MRQEGWTRRLGIRARLIALLVGTVVLLAAALIVFLPGPLDGLSRRWWESRSLGITRLLGRLCAVPLDFEDRETAAAMLAELRSTRGVNYAVLYLPDGEALAAWREVPEARPAPADGERVWYVGGAAHVSVPVVARSGVRGTLVVGFDSAELDERRREARAPVVIACALLLALGIPAAVAISALVVSPLLQMTHVAGRIAGGEAAARAGLPLNRSDEIGTLASTFGLMLDRLYEKEAGMAALAADLEKRVELRTVELQHAHREIARRLAELTSTQEQLIAADRRITVGRLAAGVAHEINNPLAYIDSNLVFLADGVADARAALSRTNRNDPVLGQILLEMGEAIAESRQGAGRVRTIVRGLRSFSRSSDEDQAAVSLTAALEGAVEMARHEIKYRAQLVKEVGPLPPVFGNEVRLSQVFLNLLVNAAQAIAPGAAEANEVRVGAWTDQHGHAVVEVGDTGAGMPPEVRARLFEPFFTTKPVGEGTGLGLSISRGLVERYGGTIEVESTPGEGSTFRVRFPPSQEGATGGAEPRDLRLVGHRRRVLVVDDEPLVCKAIERRLGRRHELVTELRARAALDRLIAGQRFDVILCDVMMPEMTGVQLREELLTRWPELRSRIVLMTGAEFDEGSKVQLAGKDVAWLHKPLDFERLQGILDEAR